MALTSCVMKVFERLALRRLKPIVGSSMDPLQFAYQDKVGVDDAIIYLLHRASSHLEGSGNTVRVMFFDFSSAFNTIKPSMLEERLCTMQVDPDTVAILSDGQATVRPTTACDIRHGGGKPFLSPSTPLTSAATPEHAIFKSSQMTPSLAASVRRWRKSTEMWWTTLCAGPSGIT